MTPTPADLTHALITALEADLVAARSAHADAVAGATHEEAKAENDKDTRGLEQSYLARGHAERVAAVETALVHAQRYVPHARPAHAPIGAGALVAVHALTPDGEPVPRVLPMQVWILPFAGGTELRVDTHLIKVVSPQAPLGRALLGARAGDDIEVGTGAQRRGWRIVTVV